VFDIRGVAGHQVVNANDIGTFGRQSFAEVGSDETRPAENDDPRTGNHK
jgi:hypothetical protein